MWNRIIELLGQLSIIPFRRFRRLVAVSELLTSCLLHYTSSPGMGKCRCPQTSCLTSPSPAPWCWSWSKGRWSTKHKGAGAATCECAGAVVGACVSACLCVWLSSMTLPFHASEYRNKEPYRCSHRCIPVCSLMWLVGFTPCIWETGSHDLALNNEWVMIK